MPGPAVLDARRTVTCGDVTATTTADLAVDAGSRRIAEPADDHGRAGPRRGRHDLALPAPGAVPPGAGRVLGGRYAVRQVIGRGGTAEVRLGRDTRTGRPVAIKALRDTLAGDPLLRAGLRREAQLLGRLRHHAVVSLLGAGHDDDVRGTHGGPYLVLEHVAGRSLRGLLRTGALGRETSIRYSLGLLAALEASHRAGVVHRDVKPANVMITSTGAVKLVDFGIARASDEPLRAVAHVHELVGTPAYFSPEQALGATTDARSDLYSAGCLLFELLAGRPPFPGDDPVVVAHQHVHEPPPQAGTGLPSLDAVIATALAKDRADRFQSAQAFRAALRSATGAWPTTASPTRPEHDLHSSSGLP